MLTLQIPLEILEHIFSFLDRDELRIAMFICSRWHQATLRHYFQKVTLYERKIRLNQTLPHAHLTTDLSLSSQHGYYIKGIQDEDFIFVMSQFPLLKKLDVSSSDNFAVDMIAISEHGGGAILQHIEEIVTMSDYDRVQNFYFNACYTCRKTIRRLEVYSCDYEINNDIHSVLYYLPQFTRLTHIKVNNLKTSDVTLFDILLCCPNLTDLDYDENSPVPMRARQQLGTTSNMQLVRLTLGISTDATPYLDYIRTNYRLESLTLILSKNIYRWFHNFDSFAGTLRRFKNLTIKRKEASLQHVSKMQTKVFYNFLAILKGDRDLRYEATFRQSEEKLENIIQVRNHRQMSFVYPIQDDDTSYLFTDEQAIVKSIEFHTKREAFPSEILKYLESYRRLERAHIVLRYASLDLSQTHMYIKTIHLSPHTFDRLYHYAPQVEFMDCSGSHYGDISQKKYCLDLTKFKSLKVFIFSLNQLNTGAYEYTFVKLDFGDRSIYRRIFCYEGHYFIQPVSEQYVTRFRWYSFTFVLMFHDRSVKLHFTE